MRQTNADTVIFTDDPEKKFGDYNDADFSMKDASLGINYEKQEIFEDTVLLLRYNCPDPSCDVACLGWSDLHRHVKSVHHKIMCDLCTRNKKVFTHEHELFTTQELRRHEKFGDDIPGAADQSGFKGHPECGFCRERFFGDDELYAHCRDKHERCHVCDRRNEGANPQYYIDYNSLEIHFRKDHFMCPDQECLEKKFVVFDSEMDLKAHQLETHPSGLTKDAKRDARRVDISSFDYRQQYQDARPRREARGGREGRGGARGRDPNAEPIPASSAQPMRRDELAYQRQMAIQSAQSVTSRSFGGQLTQSDTFAARPPANAREPQSITAPTPSDPRPTLDDLSLDPTPTESLTPQEQARRLRHAAVTERASHLLKNDAAKVAEFRTKVSNYRSGTLTAPSLVDSFFIIFDVPSAELGKLVKELADIFEDARKRDTLLKAWSDYKAINEDYPSLGPAAASSSKFGQPLTTWAANLGANNVSSSAISNQASGSRVLRLKSSTAQSGRQAASRGLTQSNPFPSLPAASAAPQSSSSSRSRPAWFDSIPTGTTPAASSKILTVSSAAASAANSARASPVPQSSGGFKAPPPSRGGASGDMFPALPPGQKPTSSVFSPGYNGAGVRRANGPAPAVAAWGMGGAVSAGASPAVDGDGDVAVGKKGKKGKKQVLYNWG